MQDNIPPAILKKVKPYVENPNMQVDVVTKVSKAASGLCMFVHAMDVYSKVGDRTWFAVKVCVMGGRMKSPEIPKHQREVVRWFNLKGNFAPHLDRERGRRYTDTK